MIYSPLSTEAGHRHYDAGNFTLSYKGKPVILDPGTGCYTSDFCLRNKLKGESSHNVYYQDADEVFSSQVFRSDVKYHSVVEEVSKNRIMLKVSRFSQDIYIREFYMDRDKIVITDRFIDNSKRFEGGLNFNEDIRMDGDRFCSSGVVVELKGIKDWEIKEYDYSPVYGSIETKQRIEYVPSGNVKIAIYAEIKRK